MGFIENVYVYPSGFIVFPSRRRVILSIAVPVLVHSRVYPAFPGSKFTPVTENSVLSKTFCQDSWYEYERRFILFGAMLVSRIRSI